jgi:hypothetical protein
LPSSALSSEKRLTSILSVNYILDIEIFQTEGGEMLHWYVREGVAEERIVRLAADARKAQPGQVRRSFGRLLVAAGQRLAAEPTPRPQRRVSVI